MPSPPRHYVRETTGGHEDPLAGAVAAASAPTLDHVADLLVARHEREPHAPLAQAEAPLEHPALRPRADEGALRAHEHVARTDLGQADVANGYLVGCDEGHGFAQHRVVLRLTAIAAGGRRRAGHRADP